MKKEWKNEGGNLVVRKSGKNSGCGVVELTHLYAETSGCVIAYWEERSVDGEPFPELHSVHDRLNDYRMAILLEAIRYGQRLAELIVESNQQST